MSRATVDEARTYECSVIVLEELEGIYDTIATAAFAHRWAYRHLCEFIEYKTGGCGIRVEYVDPRYTSQRCSECGHRARQNRPERSRFECANCGSRANADYNAAKNVALRYVRDSPQSSSRTGIRRCALKSGTVSPNGEFVPMGRRRSPPISRSPESDGRPISTSRYVSDRMRRCRYPATRRPRRRRSRPRRRPCGC
ncbi:MAG: transposase [Haloarculaceae archaeon]